MGLLTALGGLFQSDDDLANGNLNGLQRFGMSLNDNNAPIEQSALAALAQLRQQGVTNPQQILSKLATINPDYAEKAADIQAKNPLAAAFSNFTPTNTSTNNPGGVANPGTQTQDPSVLQPESPDDKRNYDFLNTKVPPQYRALIRQISNGDESVGNADSLRSNGLLALASNFDPSLSKTDFAARQATAKDMAPGGKSGQALKSINTATKHLAQVVIAGLDLNNNNNVAGNWFGNTVSKYSGQDPTTNFDSTVDTVAPELAKAANGGGDTTEGDRNSQKASFSSSLSPSQILGAAAGKVDLMQSKAQEIGKAYANTMGKNPKNIIDPTNQQTLQDIKDLHLLSQKDGGLDTPEAQIIVHRLRAISGNGNQQPTSTSGLDKSALVAEAKRRGLIK